MRNKMAAVTMNLRMEYKLADTLSTGSEIIYDSLCCIHVCYHVCSSVHDIQQDKDSYKEQKFKSHFLCLKLC